MLKFKLSRRGKKKQPTYRLVVVDKRKDPWGKAREDVGSYNPHIKKAQFNVERIKYWISKGAQPTETVHNLLVKEKILNAPKKKIKIKKKKKTTAEQPPPPNQGTPTTEPVTQVENQKKSEEPKKDEPGAEPKTEPKEEKTEEPKKEEETKKVPTTD